MTEDLEKKIKHYKTLCRILLNTLSEYERLDVPMIFKGKRKMYGAVEYDARKIYLSIAQDFQERRDSLLHEVLHVTQRGIPENKIKKLSRAIIKDLYYA